ncbi:MAG: DUF445 domain-containing protein [Syntrophomonas sp.]|nr:DUF445 domain-containing protein [Syntrophomonas sp.]
MRNMKTAATTLLVLTVLGSLAAWNFRASFTGGLFFAAFEAALVGALADWFAVVALFRHPLGLKFIPHTAIIPNNRGRIIEGIVKIVETDWLSLDFIAAKVQAYPLLDGLAEALSADEVRRGFEETAQSISHNIIENLDPADLSEFFHTMLSDNLDSIKFAPSLVESIEDTVKQLYSDDVIRLMLDWAIASTSGEEFEQSIKRLLTRAVADYSNQGSFVRRLGKGLGETLDIVNYDDAALILSHRINHFLKEMKAPDNRFHVRIKQEIENLQLLDPAAASAVLGDSVRKFVGTETGIKATSELFAVVKDQLLRDGDRGMPLVTYLTGVILQQVAAIRQDEMRKAELEAWLKDKIISLLERYHALIGRMVREKLESLNDAGLVESLEDKVGDDLQWIRINGTVIGALVGIVQYLVLHLI